MEATDLNDLATRYDGMTHVWKFGYGSNMGQEFLRAKKNLNPVKFERCILRGFQLSFPEGKGIEFVDPAFATLKPNPDAFVHGVSTLFSIEDAVKLNAQEGVGRAYNLAVHKVLLYDGVTEIDVEVFVNPKPIPLDFPEGVCSVRYRDILVNGAKEVDLDPTWIEKLQQLLTYSPSPETLARREKLPPPSALPCLNIEELARHNGKNDGYPHYISSCGYVFKVKDFFDIFHGRDITFRNILHARGINLETNDDGGKSPFPRLSKVEQPALQYALCYRDRYIFKAGGAIAVLKEFWEQQDEHLDGVYTGNTLSTLLEQKCGMGR